MRVAVPFDALDPKTRLSGLLDPDERRAFARVLLEDVLDAIERTLDGVDGVEAPPTVYATGPVAVDRPVVVDDRPLDPLVDDLLSEAPVAVVMADLGLATPAALRRLFEPATDVVLAPGRGGGTNALVVRDASFTVDFHGVSLRDHRQIADDGGASLAEVDSMRLATDVDEPADLVELLLHGEGRAPAWLRERGFEIAVDEGRATVTRE